MRIAFKTGNIVDETTEALVSTGNVQLNMSGGVNGELLLRGGQNMQHQLHEYLRQNQLRHVPPGFVMEIGPEPFRFQCVVYTVAIDGFYGSSVDLVVTALTHALDLIAAKGCRTVAIPALATGYGPLKMPDFAQALHRALAACNWPFDEMRVVLRNQYDMEQVRGAYERL